MPPRALATGYGVLAGPTSGATYAAASTSSPGAPVVAVLIVCDRLVPYLSYLRQRRPDLFGRAARHRPTAADLAAVPQLTPQELAERREATLVVDTRGGMAYRIGQVPGTLNVRDDQLESLLSQGSPLPPGRTVVFVCPLGGKSTGLATLARQARQDPRPASPPGATPAFPWRPVRGR